MIIELIQKQTGIELSYVTKTGGIAFKDFKIADKPFHYPIWSANAPQLLDGYKDISGKPVGLKYAKRFNLFDLKQFIAKLPQDELDELYDFREPQMFAFDIETLIGDEFEKPETARQPIVSIATTADDPTLTTIVMSTDELTAEEAAEISVIVNEYLKPLKLANDVAVKYVYMPSEQAMLHTWTTKVFKSIPALTGWYIDGYDLPYYRNRCKQLGIDVGQASPRGTVDQHGNPTHKVIEDYKALIENYEYSLGTVDSYGLDWISKKILDLGKLYYENGLKHLYQTNKVRFLAYNAIDSILCILIHQRKKTINAIYMLAATSGLAYKECKGPVKQAESVCMQWILDTYGGNVVVAEDGEWDSVMPYEGGWVKAIFKHFARNVVCYDVSSQYPSAKRTFNLSPELYIKELSNCTQEEIDRYKADPNYTVTIRGGLYDNSKTGMYKAVQTALYTRRKGFQGNQFDYVNIADKINHELKRRGLLTSI